MSAPFLSPPIFSWPAAPNGLLYTYAAGSTTPKTTFADAAATIPNTNPVLLDGTGSATVRLGVGSYKFVLLDQTGTVTIWTADNYDTLAGTSQTAAEITAGVTPTSTQYGEGDIRRYGATSTPTLTSALTAADNSAAFNTAFSVSNAGGKAAYIPAGIWACTTSPTTVGNCSMKGEGNSSILFANGCNGITFVAGSSYSTVPVNRFFRDFAIQGSNSTNSTYSGIYANVAVGGNIPGCDFGNIWIENFQYAVNARGFVNTSWHAVNAYNVYYGFYFNGQNVDNHLTGCNMIRGSMTGSGGAGGYVFNSQAGETTQSTHMTGCKAYSFDYNVNVGLVEELQIEHCDLSNAQITCVNVTSTIFGFWLRDCWIETNASSATTGIKIAAIVPSANTKIQLLNNYINCDIAYAGSQGINVGSSNVGILVQGNQVKGFDQGILIGGVCQGASIKHNTVDINTSVYSATSLAIQIDSLAYDTQVGPNWVVQGTAQAATCSNSSADISVPTIAAFPAGTPVQFSVTANGFTSGVTYYVATNNGTYLTIGTYAASAVIVCTGSTATNISAAPLPLQFSSSTTPAGLKFMGRGAFIGTLSDPSNLGVIGWVADSGTVMLSPPASYTGSSGATTMTMTGVPPYLWPVTTQYFKPVIEDNTTPANGYGKITGGGVVTLYPSVASGAWTNSGTKGILQGPIQWPYL